MVVAVGESVVMSDVLVVSVSLFDLFIVSWFVATWLAKKVACFRDSLWTKFEFYEACLF